MHRRAVLATVALFAASVLLFLQRERLTVAASLLATFTKFPYSSINIESIPLETSVQDQDRYDVVPSVIHQVRLGGLAMRPDWVKARRSCQTLHPNWTMHVWEDQSADDFVARQYPHLFSIYRGYPLEIQRSNVLRYLLLHHYGGVYLDLDLYCHRRLDFLRNETFLTPPANPTGVNNAFIVSSQGHPFWQHLMDNLPRYNLAWYTPYVTNMFSTGCHFFSTMHRTYADQHSLKILDSTHKLNGHVTTPLFEHLGASSWHQGDAKMILQLGILVDICKRHSALVLAAAVLILFAVVFIVLARHRVGRLQRDLEKSKSGLD